MFAPGGERGFGRTSPVLVRLVPRVDLRPRGRYAERLIGAAMSRTGTQDRAAADSSAKSTRP